MIESFSTKKLAICSISLQLALIGLISLSQLGIEIPVLRQIVGFICLVLIPGILILRILRIHNISIIESLLYAVGLSIAFIYFVGLFNNFVLPLLGISRPISLFPVTISLTVFTFILGVIAYLRDKDFTPPCPGPEIHFDKGKKAFLSPYLLLILLPVLAVLGTSLVNAYQDNRVLLILLALIAVVVALVAYDKLPQSVYPLAVVMIAISLMFHMSLISLTLHDADIQIEHYFQYLVLRNGCWDSTIPNNYNTCLSIVFLCPIYSLLINIDSVWIFKVVYFTLFSLVPLALFCIYREQIEVKEAFLSVFFYMAIPDLFFTMAHLARQVIAELFFVLIILLITDRKLKPAQKSTLVIIFSLSLPLSHYATAYISIVLLGIGWLFLLLIKNSKVLDLWQRLSQKSSPSSANPGSNILNPDLFRSSLLTGTLICLLIVFSLTWYMYTTKSSGFDTIIGVGKNVYIGLAEFFEPTVRESIVNTGLGEGFLKAESLSKARRIYQYLTQFFIIVGFFVMFLNPKRFKFKVEYISITIGVIMILLSCIILPRFSVNLKFVRFYHISLLLLAPLCIIGFETIWQGISGLSNLITLSNNNNNKANNLVCLIFLTLALIIPYFLFNNNFFHAFTNQRASIALGPYKTDWCNLFYQKEVNAGLWLSKNMSDKTNVYADTSGIILLNQRLYGRVFMIPSTGAIPNSSYVFLRTWNVKYNEFSVSTSRGVDTIYVHVNLMNRPTLTKRLNKSSIIYNNSAAKVLVLVE